jgi:putative tricarboxylic transport membrane protein
MAVHDARAHRPQAPVWSRLLRHCDVWSGLLFMAVAAVGLWVSRDYAVGTAFRMSTGYVPRLLLWILLVLGAAVLVSGIRSTDREGELEPGGSWRAVILVPTALVAFALSLQRFGLLVACAFLIGIASLAIRGLRPREAVAAGLLLTFLTWGIFVRALGLTIPVWPE